MWPNYQVQPLARRRSSRALPGPPRPRCAAPSSAAGVTGALAVAAAAAVILAQRRRLQQKDEEIKQLSSVSREQSPRGWCWLGLLLGILLVILLTTAPAARRLGSSPRRAEPAGLVLAWLAVRHRISHPSTAGAAASRGIQNDFKTLVAYSKTSHLGYTVLAFDLHHSMPLPLERPCPLLGTAPPQAPSSAFSDGSSKALSQRLLRNYLDSAHEELLSRQQYQHSRHSARSDRGDPTAAWVAEQAQQERLPYRSGGSAGHAAAKGVPTDSSWEAALPWQAPSRIPSGARPHSGGSAAAPAAGGGGGGQGAPAGPLAPGAAAPASAASPFAGSRHESEPESPFSLAPSGPSTAPPASGSSAFAALAQAPWSAGGRAPSTQGSAEPGPGSLSPAPPASGGSAFAALAAAPWSTGARPPTSGGEASGSAFAGAAGQAPWSGNGEAASSGRGAPLSSWADSERRRLPPIPSDSSSVGDGRTMCPFVAGRGRLCTPGCSGTCLLASCMILGGSGYRIY